MNTMSCAVSADLRRHEAEQDRESRIYDWMEQTARELRLQTLDDPDLLFEVMQGAVTDGEVPAACKAAQIAMFQICDDLLGFAPGQIPYRLRKVMDDYASAIRGAVNDVVIRDLERKHPNLDWSAL